MKYDDFKIFKFSTISKIVDLKRYNFSRIYKNINFKRYKYILVYVADFIISIIKYIFFGILKSVNFIRYNFLRIYKNIDFKRHKSNLVLAIGSVVFFIKYIFSRIYKISNLRRFNFSRIYNSINLRRFNFLKVYKFDVFKIFKFSTILKIIYLKKNQYIPLYGAGFIIFVALIYLSIPMFFNYDKSELGNIVCKDLNIECSIQGKVRYSFFPTPRIKIKDLIIQDFVDKKNTLGKIDNTVIKLSFYNLSNKNKLNFTKIEFQKAEINFDLHKLEEYKNFFKKEFNSKYVSENDKRYLLENYAFIEIFKGNVNEVAFIKKK